MGEKISHFDDKQIIEAVIDEGALDADLREHLLECSACRRQKESLQASLQNFGWISRAHAPANFRKPKIPRQGAESAGPLWKFRPALAFAAAVALVVLLLSPLTFKKDRIFTQDDVYREMVQDEKFMSEIENLEENSLPRFYVDIGEEGEDEGDAQPPTIKDEGMNQTPRIQNARVDNA